MSARLKLLSTIAADIVFLAIVLAAAALFLEVLARVVQRNSRPMIPFVLDDLGGPRLSPDLDLPVRLAHYDRMQLTTDALGARVADPAARNASRAGGILFVGDSQVLGWGLSFADTAAARLAQRIRMSADRVTILAAPSQDPERELHWAREYARAHPQRQHIEVVALNMGNDLDEIYLGRVGMRFPSGGSLTFWLSRHSVAFLDFSLLRHSLAQRKRDEHQEVNYAMLLLNDAERALLAECVAQSLDTLLKALPPADERLILIIPQDTQIALSQFRKYRSLYRTESDYALHEAAQRRAVQRLEALQSDIAERVKVLGLSVVVTEPALRAALGKPNLIDTHSHHLMAQGQDITAQVLAAALGRKL